MIRNTLSFCLGLCLFFTLFVGVFAQQNPIPTAFMQSAPPVDLKDAFTIPAKATPEELFERAQKAIEAVRQNINEENQKELQGKLADFFSQIADRILAEKPSDEMKFQAIRLKTQSWALKVELDPSQREAFKKYLEELDKQDLDKALIAEGKAMYYIFGLIELVMSDDPSIEEFVKLKDEVKKYFQEYVQYGALQIVPVIFNIAGSLAEKTGNEQLAIETMQEFAELLEKVDDPSVQELASGIKATLYRQSLIGKEFTLEGIMLDGTKFDWSKYKGKVVIIDFWATWCRPCLEATKVLKELYATYKDKGLEIIGVDVWEREGTTTEEIKKFLAKEKITWAQIDDQQTVKAEMGNLAEKYNIEAVPTLFVIDRDGKLLSFDLNCFDGSLQEVIGELFEEKKAEEK
ncbi:MAG: TlpA disulfide reductase family protein [Thermoguttaceae bacterium]